jgi:type II secretory ATPase GspE/PulE/Tfp pilus assembly ATPase PilB-like protein
LLLTTFHAGSAAGAVNRLCDMGIEPYLLRSGVRAVLCQRLVRRLCACRRELATDDERLGLDVRSGFAPVGCTDCLRTGYRGRLVLAELFRPDSPSVARAVLSRSDEQRLEELAVEAGMRAVGRRALDAVESGATSPAEVRRVLGFQRL